MQWYFLTRTDFTTPGMIGLSQFFQRPLSDISSANGATLICQGFGTLLWMYVLRNLSFYASVNKT